MVSRDSRYLLEPGPTRHISYPALVSPYATDVEVAPHRLDPYWSAVLWRASGGMPIAWDSRELRVRHARMGVARRPRQAKDCIRDLLAHPWRRRLLEQVAMVLSWRVLSEEHLVSGTGYTSGRLHKHGIDAGLVQSGRLASARYFSRWSSLKFFRLGGRWDQLRRVARYLRHEEWEAVYGSVDLLARASSDRHDLLATELSWRLAEADPVTWPAVLGEGHAAWARACGWEGAQRSDAVWVRADGMVVLVEIVGVLYPGKAAAIASMLSRRRDRVVLLVSVANGAPAMMRLISEALWSLPDAVASGAANRVGMVDWQDWFPVPGSVREDFPRLPVVRPTSADPGGWSRGFLADAFDFPWSGDPGVVERARACWAMPAWLRPARPDLAEHNARRAAAIAARRA